MTTYLYVWKNNEKRKAMFRRECRIIARGKMNSVLIEFNDGQREIMSGNSIHRGRKSQDATKSQENTDA